GGRLWLPAVIGLEVVEAVEVEAGEAAVDAVGQIALERGPDGVERDPGVELFDDLVDDLLLLLDVVALRDFTDQGDGSEPVFDESGAAPFSLRSISLPPIDPVHRRHRGRITTMSTGGGWGVGSGEVRGGDRRICISAGCVRRVAMWWHQLWCRWHQLWCRWHQLWCRWHQLWCRSTIGGWVLRGLVAAQVVGASELVVGVAGGGAVVSRPPMDADAQDALGLVGDAHRIVVLIG